LFIIISSIGHRQRGEARTDGRLAGLRHPCCRSAVLLLAFLFLDLNLDGRQRAQPARVLSQVGEAISAFARLLGFVGEGTVAPERDTALLGFAGQDRDERIVVRVAEVIRRLQPPTMTPVVPPASSLLKNRRQAPLGLVPL
jgi:hypothetical protein